LNGYAAGFSFLYLKENEKGILSGAKSEKAKKRKSENFYLINMEKKILNNGTYRGDNLRIEGINNTIFGSNLIVVGNCNKVVGNCNKVVGNNNSINGDWCSIQGNRNYVVGKDNLIVGALNLISGENVVLGDTNAVDPSCIVIGFRNIMTKSVPSSNRPNIQIQLFQNSVLKPNSRPEEATEANKDAEKGGGAAKRKSPDQVVDLDDLKKTKKGLDQ